MYSSIFLLKMQESASNTNKYYQKTKYISHKDTNDTKKT